MHLLKRQCSIVNFEPLRKTMLNVYAASHAAMPMVPGSPSVFAGLQRPNDAEPTNTNPKTWLPMLPLKLTSCEEKLKSGLKFMTGSKFEQALECFTSIYYTLPFIVVKSSLQKDVLTLLQYCREYITAMRVELARREEKDPRRQCELACYFTSCNLQPLHRILALRVAIKTAYGIKNHKLAASFCRRLLELAVTHKSSPQIAKLVNRNQIRGVLQACQKDETDKAEINYDDSKNFELCCESFTPIYQGSDGASHCPYCASAFLKKYAGNVCSTCKVSQIGGSGTGLDNVAKN
jgi:coatomer protein complex subunit alpha (xenin)